MSLETQDVVRTRLETSAETEVVWRRAREMKLPERGKKRGGGKTFQRPWTWKRLEQ